MTTALMFYLFIYLCIYLFTYVLDDIVDKYNSTYHTPIKMKPIDVKSNSYAEYSVESNEKDPKFPVGDHIIISEYRDIFVKS